MITTVTLNPAVDKTIEIDNFQIGTVNRVSSVRLDAGGKGINVSKVIKSLGSSSRAVGILSGKSGSFIKEYLDSENIENHFIITKGDTRTNTKIVDKINHTNTDINECGPLVSEEDLHKVNKEFCKGLNENSVVVFSGSIPKNVSRNIYMDWIKEAKKNGAKTILDADGELFKQGIKAGPYLIKPNIHELEEFFSQNISTKEEAVRLSRELFKYGIKIIVISLGAHGALFIKKDAAVSVSGIKVQVQSTVGAGDSMVAALAVAIDKNYDFEKSIKLSVACGTANVTTSGTQAADLETVLSFEKQVKYEYINL
ncbi:1-phosphofructokinase [Clostridium sp. JN-9]|uniref:1-phosphofructokinase n=1 Tax=Clostridium sp. JN-9 TaxID=2507159 RepID=UPI000FFE1684|nr:1-phosphofructokinase [Clostridium sp. JN-9]QAT41304.1 1-phosphofructokinase [Clostridium sp. JN-9]